MKQLLAIKIKLIVTLSIVLVVAFVSTNLVSYLVSRNSFRATSLDETLPLINHNIYSEIQRDILKPIHVSSLMCNDTFLKDWVLNGERDVPKVVKYLNEIRARYGFFTAFFVSDKTGLYYTYKGILKKIDKKDPHDVWYYTFKKMNLALDLEVDTDQAHRNTLTVFLNHRLNDYKGGFLGVTGVGLNMDQVGSILREYQKKYHRSIYLVDQKGLVQMHSNPKYVHKISLAEHLGDRESARIILAETEKPISHSVEKDGGSLLLATRYFSDFGWFLIVEQDESSGMAGIREALFSNLLLGLLVTVFIVCAVVFVVNRFQRTLEVMASMDDLTKVPNRRYFMESLNRELAQSQRYGKKLCLLMMDADNFKGINDNFGHDAGDQTLKHLADILRGTLRESDLLGRLGGEEFAAILPETQLDEAETAAQRIRREVMKSRLPYGDRDIRLTVSIGVACARDGVPDAKELLRRADMAMYRAKDAGRNRVAVADRENKTDGAAG